MAPEEKPKKTSLPTLRAGPNSTAPFSTSSETAKPEVPPDLAPDKLHQCSQCGQDEWVHQQFWARTVGADHGFVSQIMKRPPRTQPDILDIAAAIARSRRRPSQDPRNDIEERMEFHVSPNSKRAWR